MNTPEQMRADPRVWEVRVPLVCGSRHEKFFYSEKYAREFAECLSANEYGNSGLQIHTKTRTIYINDDES